jgi:hypothetical protein
MRKLIALGILVVALAGCGGDVEGESDTYQGDTLVNESDSLEVHTVNLPDGTTSYCVTFSGWSDGVSISCKHEYETETP